MSLHHSSKKMPLLNNSILLASDVGVNENAVVCRTERRPCCKTGINTKFGEWYYPNNSMVPRMSERWLFYRDRADNGTINLNRVSENEVTGKFCCQAPDKYCDGLNHTLCVELGNITNSQIIN